MRFSLAFLFLLGACGGDDDDGGGGPDAPLGVDGSGGGGDGGGGGGDGGGGGRSFSFELEPSTITIEGTQVQAFQLTNISATGVSLAGGIHYHVYLDTTSGPYIIYSDDVPTSPDVFIDEGTTAGSHTVIGSLEDENHDPIGVESSRPLTVIVASP